MRLPASALPLLCAATLCGATGCALLSEIGNQYGVISFDPPKLEAPPSLLPPPSTPVSAIALSALPVDLDNDYAIPIGDVSVSSGLCSSRQGGVFDFASIWKSLCEGTRTVLFRPLGPGEQPTATLRIRIEALSTFYDSGQASCSAAARFSILRGAGPDALRLYDKTCKGSAESGWDPSSGVIPSCIYSALARMRDDFLADLDGDPALVDRIAESGEIGIPGNPKPKEPAMVDFSLRDGNSGDSRDVKIGTCAVECNDWEASRVGFWAKIRIEALCRDQLGASSDRIRVCYTKETFDQNAGRWEFEFEAFQRTELLIEYNQFTHQGHGIADPPLLNLSADEALERLRAAILNEMNARGRTVQLGSAASGGAIVRFGDLRTDSRYGLLVVPFRLVD